MEMVGPGGWMELTVVQINRYKYPRFKQRRFLVSTVAKQQLRPNLTVMDRLAGGNGWEAVVLECGEDIAQGILELGGHLVEGGGGA